MAAVGGGALCLHHALLARLQARGQVAFHLLHFGAQGAVVNWFAVDGGRHHAEHHRVVVFRGAVDELREMGRQVLPGLLAQGVKEVARGQKHAQHLRRRGTARRVEVRAGGIVEA